MDKISLEQLEETQKDLFKKQCDLDIQKAFVKHFIKKKQSEQLTIPVVVKSLKENGVLTFDEYLKANNCTQSKYGTWLKNGIYINTYEFVEIRKEYDKI